MRVRRWRLRPGFHRRVLAVAPVPLVVVDRSGSLTYVNGRAARTFGLEEGQRLADRFVAGTSSTAQAWLVRSAAGRPADTFFEGTLLTGSGAERHVQMTAVDQLRSPLVRGLVLSLVDATDQQARVESLVRQATTDPLTGLPNRLLLLDRLERTGAGSLALLDLDDFKRVNDAHGHEVGDQVLVAVAGRLLDGIGPEATVARFGGDEFLVLLPGVPTEEAVRLLEAAVQAIAAPITVGLLTVTVTASAGVAEIGELRPERALSRADAATYAAKASGRAGVQVFDAPSAVPTRRELAAVVERLEHQTRTDPLTDLPNVRALREALARVGAAAQRSGVPFSVAFVDIDHFGAFNKTHGDAAGDRVLTAVAQVLSGTVRAGDLVFRKGGEEIVVLMPDTSLAAAAAVGERLRAAVEALGVVHGGIAGVPVVTVTVGIAACSDRSTPPDRVVEGAARASFDAKSSGRRNSVRIGAPAPGAGLG